MGAQDVAVTMMTVDDFRRNAIVGYRMGGTPAVSLPATRCRREADTRSQ